MKTPLFWKKVVMRLVFLLSDSIFYLISMISLLRGLLLTWRKYKSRPIRLSKTIEVWKKATSKPKSPSRVPNNQSARAEAGYSTWNQPRVCNTWNACIFRVSTTSSHRSGTLNVLYRYRNIRTHIRSFKLEHMAFGMSCGPSVRLRRRRRQLRRSPVSLAVEQNSKNKIPVLRPTRFTNSSQRPNLKTAKYRKPMLHRTLERLQMRKESTVWRIDTRRAQTRVR